MLFFAAQWRSLVPFAALTPRINPRLLLPFAGSAWGTNPPPMKLLFVASPVAVSFPQTPAVASWSFPTRFCARKRAGIVRVPWSSSPLCRCGSTGRDSYPAQQAVRVPWNSRPFVPLVEALRATVFGRMAPFNCACNAQCGR